MKSAPRSRARALAAPLLALLAFGCNRKAPDGEYFGTTERVGKSDTTFYVNAHDEPEYIDPGLSTESVGSTLMLDLFEGLVLLHPDDLRPVQGVATRWDRSDDNRIFRFYLRPEAKWSDGQRVVAGDFAYAWRRVLTASSGARMATLMYPIKNGQLFHQGKLLVTREALDLRDGPEGKTTGPGLPEHQAVRILQTTPAKTKVAPLARTIGETLTFAQDQLVATNDTRAPTLAAEAPAEVLALGPEVTCNGSPDRWYRVRVGDATGHLPGCALVDDPKATWALVERYDDLPTFRPPAPPPSAPPDESDTADPDAPKASEAPEPAPAPEPTGFVPLSALTADPAVIGVRAVGDDVFEVELDKPTPYFLELCGYVTFMPVRRDVIEKWEAKGRPDLWYRPENIVTNGPYTLDEHKFRYEITFKKNPHYYRRDDVKIDRVVWLEISSYDATMNLYETGEIDYIGANLSLPQAYMDVLEGYKDFDRSLWLATYWYEFNTQKPPVDNLLVRRALNLAVDKQQLIDTVTRGDQQPATHVIPDFIGSGYSKLAADENDPLGRKLFAGKGYEFDPDYARGLLREAGYPVTKEGEGWRAEGFPPLEILYNTSEGHRNIAVALQDMWKRHLGISVQLRNEEWKVMISNLREGNYQVARFGWVADYNHPHTFLDTFLSYSQNNWTRYEDPQLDAMVEKAARTADPDESIRLYREAEKRATDATTRLPLYFYTKSTLIKPYVKGYFPNGQNRHPIRWMWIDPSWKTDHDNRPTYPPEELPPPGIIAP